jgi:hypothetical protein
VSKSKFISQKERMANLSPKRKRELEELKKSNYQIEKYEYFDKPQENLID